MLLKQNIDQNNGQLYKQFYTGIFSLYISLLQQDYVKYMQELGDIRTRLKKGSDVYELYDKAMKQLEEKSRVSTE